MWYLTDVTNRSGLLLLDGYSEMTELGNNDSFIAHSVPKLPYAEASSSHQQEVKGKATVL